MSTLSAGDESVTATIAKERYYAESYARAEHDRLWPNVWLHAAALDRLPRPGAFLRVELGGVDVLLVRGEDATVRAFHNVCQHRGRRLVDARSGEAKALRCPQHAWQWRLDGSLLHVPDREVFGCLLDDGAALHALPCELWAGQAWVHLGTPRETLREWLAPLVEQLEKYDLESHALVEETTYDVPCNWKAAADQFNEAYHVRTVHPYLMGALDDTTVRDEVHGPHVFSTFRIGTPSPRNQLTELSPVLVEFLTANGVDPASLDGDATRAPEALRRAMRARGIVKLDDDELLSCRNWSVFPSIRLSAYGHMFQIDRYRPHPTDPERSWLDQYTFMRVMPGEPRPTAAVASFTCTAEREGELVTEGGAKLPRVVDDDARQMVAVQRGMHSPGFRELRLGGHERRIVHMHAMLDLYVGAV